MPSLDNCINALYEPGFIGGSSGVTPVVPVVTSTSEARFAGAGSFSAAALIPGSTVQISATFAGEGSLSALGTGPDHFEANATFAGSSTLSVDAQWTPAAISTLLWLDANAAPTFTLSGSDVTQWNDKSGNGNHVAQATTGNKPDYDTVTNTINGLPVVSFDGTDDRLQKDALSGWPADNGSVVTICQVWRYRSGTMSRAFFDISTGTMTNTTALGFSGNTFAIFLRTTITSSPAQSANNVFAQNVPFVVTFTVKSDKRQIFINGHQNGSNTNNNGTSAYTNLRLGGLFQDTFHILGDLGEMIVVSGDDTTTRRLIEDYLAMKWATPRIHQGNERLAGQGTLSVNAVINP